jgi:hypothetical protein
MKISLSFLIICTAAIGALSGCTGASRAPGKTMFIDVHEFGAGKVTAADVAKAHQADLAAQGKHDVRFIQYWVDEARGTVYCLSEAKDASSVTATHREAHGLLPARVVPVSGGTPAPANATDASLFLDVHNLGAGKVTAADVAAAHEKDLAVQAQHGVRFINYWVDEANGQVFCLSSAPHADAVRETHRHAHGLLPDTITKVIKGE